MIDELILRERLEGLQRILKAGHAELAEHLVRCMIDEIDLKLEQFERDYEAEYAS